MDENDYLARFKKAAALFNKSTLKKKEMELAIGFHLDSVFLKLYKIAWASPDQDPLTAESRIFFSIWLGEQALQQSVLYYNIHALKLRKLKGYKIESRKFAADFRAGFKNFEAQWPNVSTDFGPLTLMQGTIKVDMANFDAEILHLSTLFLELAPLVDHTLLKFKH